MVSYNSVNTGSGNVLLPDGTKPSSEPMLSSDMRFCGILWHSYIFILHKTLQYIAQSQLQAMTRNI